MEIRRFVDFGRVIAESPEASRSPVFTDFLDCFLVLGTPLEIRRFIFGYGGMRFVFTRFRLQSSMLCIKEINITHGLITTPMEVCQSH